MATQHASNGRIPLALQSVFLASNQGHEVTEAPKGGMASKTFFSSLSKKSKAKMLLPKIAWVFGSAWKNNNHTQKKTNGKTEVVSRDTLLSSDSVGTLDTDMTASYRSTRSNSKRRQKKIPEKIHIEFQALDENKELTDESTASLQQEPQLIDEISTMSPQDYLNGLLSCRGYSTETKKVKETGYCYVAKPTPLQLASYHRHVIDIARKGDNKKLEGIMTCGISPNPCNTYGESLVHTVCRRCEPPTLQVLLDAGTKLRVADDYGRTPLHDACWRADPGFGIIEMIIDNNNNDHSNLFLFQMADARGSLPLSYVHKDQWPEWNRFLESKKDIWWPVDGSSSVFPDAPTSLGSMPDPANAIDPEVAAMVTAGRITPQQGIQANADRKKIIEEEEEEDEEEEMSDDESDYSESDGEYSDDEDYSSDEDGSYDSDDFSETSVDDLDISLQAEDLKDMMGRIAYARAHA